MNLRIREIRNALGITQQELATRMDIDLKTIGNWERGKTIPNAEQVWNLALALGCTPNYLLGWPDGDKAVR